MSKNSRDYVQEDDATANGRHAGRELRALTVQARNERIDNGAVMLLGRCARIAAEY
jgi:hypothetical protein